MIGSDTGSCRPTTTLQPPKKTRSKPKYTGEELWPDKFFGPWRDEKRHQNHPYTRLSKNKELQLIKGVLNKWTSLNGVLLTGFYSMGF
jgi:hypothetical protein